MFHLNNLQETDSMNELGQNKLKEKDDEFNKAVKIIKSVTAVYGNIKFYIYIYLLNLEPKKIFQF